MAHVWAAECGLLGSDAPRHAASALRGWSRRASSTIASSSPICTASPGSVGTFRGRSRAVQIAPAANSARRGSPRALRSPGRRAIRRGRRAEPQASGETRPACAPTRQGGRGTAIATRWPASRRMRAARHGRRSCGPKRNRAAPSPGRPGWLLRLLSPRHEGSCCRRCCVKRRFLPRLLELFSGRSPASCLPAAPRSRGFR
jgi:hypothetical protein